ncbi:MAG: hypothetical protein WA823_16240 [Candidatus Acidiferrales bacterium]
MLRKPGTKCFPGNLLVIRALEGKSSKANFWARPLVGLGVAKADTLYTRMLKMTLALERKSTTDPSAGL